MYFHIVIIQSRILVLSYNLPINKYHTVKLTEEKLEFDESLLTFSFIQDSIPNGILITRSEGFVEITGTPLSNQKDLFAFDLNFTSDQCEIVKRIVLARSPNSPTISVISGSFQQSIVSGNQIEPIELSYGGSAEGWYGWPKDWPNTSKLSAKHIISACNESLKRLKTDYIDLYQMHHIDRDTPWEEIWQAMEFLIAQGIVLYIGSSNFAGWHIARANEIAKKRNFMGLVSEQSLYNLTQRSVELEVLPSCKEYGLGFIPWSPLAGGVLAGKPPDDTKSRRKSSGEIYNKFEDQLDKYFSI